MMTDTRYKNMFRKPPEKFTAAQAPMSAGAVLLCAVAALCVTSLILLSASRAESAMRLSQAAMDSSSGYYRACAEANSDLAALRSGDSFPCRLDRAYGISDTQELHVSVDIQGPDIYTVSEWRSIPSGSWEPDQTLQVAK